MDVIMSNTLNFPIKYKYARVTPGDYVKTEFDNFSYRYIASKNNVIDVLVNTSEVTDMGHMFDSCSLMTITQFDTSKVTNMEYMFYDCVGLKYIPLLDTSNATNMSYMFCNCGKLTTIPQLNTSKVTNMSYMFCNCEELISIPLLDCQNISKISSFFGYSNNKVIVTDLGGFKDLGKKSVSGIGSNFLDKADKLTHESLMNVINNLYDRSANGLSTLSISFGTTNLNKLSDEEKSIAINKGWTLL